ncbi:hypothetical protein BJV78DRAFT_1219779 [Lactifluus subvellereus]|nr:hypothetical protein BJV78DRAFT_1219779 [Lactifluus subvellereus]
MGFSWRGRREGGVKAGALRRDGLELAYRADICCCSHAFYQRRCRFSQGKEAPGPLWVTSLTLLRRFLHRCPSKIKPSPLNAVHGPATAPSSAKNAREHSPLGGSGTDTSGRTSRTGSIAHPRIAPGEAIVPRSSKSIGRTNTETKVQFLRGSNPSRGIHHPWCHVRRRCGGPCTFISRSKDVGARKARRMGGPVGSHREEGWTVTSNTFPIPLSPTAFSAITFVQYGTHRCILVTTILRA